MNESNRHGTGGAPGPDERAWSENPGAFDNEGWGQGPWGSNGDGGDGGWGGYGGLQPDPYANLGATDAGPGPQPEYRDYRSQNEYADHGADYGYVGPAAAPPASGNGGGKGTIAAIVIAVLALAGAGIAVGFAGNELGWFGGGDNTAATSDRRADRDNQGADGSGDTSADTTETSRRAEGFTAPANWSHCHGSGDPGDFNLAYAGTGVTSCPFAQAVRDSFVEHFLDTGNTSGTITAYSTVTGRSYTMTCTDDGDYVTCRGGNNAVVHIV